MPAATRCSGSRLAHGCARSAGSSLVHRSTASRRGSPACCGSGCEHDSGYPSNWLTDLGRILPKQTISIVPAGAGIGVMKEQYASSLQLLMAVCGLVLLIACANVANLLLARSVARRTQTAVRMAIGASRAHIVRQALIESILLAIAGGIAGLAVAVGAARLLLSLAFSVSTFLPIASVAVAARARVRLRPIRPHRHRLRRGARLAGDANGSDRRAARIGSIDRRSFVEDTHGAPRRPGDPLCRPRCGRDDARPESE